MKVSELKKVIFSKLTLTEKVELKNFGRPIPALNIVQTQAKCKSRAAFTRKFDKTDYDKIT